jgi:hypothetical protein
VHPRSRPLWLLNVCMHLFETYYWWSEAATAQTTAKLLSQSSKYLVLNGRSEVIVAERMKQIATALLTGRVKDARAYLLLMGVPFLTLYILLHYPVVVVARRSTGP